MRHTPPGCITSFAYIYLYGLAGTCGSIQPVLQRLFIGCPLYCPLSWHIITCTPQGQQLHIIPHIQDSSIILHAPFEESACIVVWQIKHAHFLPIHLRVSSRQYFPWSGLFGGTRTIRRFCSLAAEEKKASLPVPANI